MRSGKLFADIGLPQLDPELDRVMICGSPSMLKELVEMLEAQRFVEGTSHGRGSDVVERAFVEK